MNRPLPLSLAIALTLGSSAAQALGLGGITVKSELNEPLRAEIPVFVSGPEEAKTLQANLASAEEFARVGLNIGSMAVPITFDIIRNSRGEPVIEVTSEQPVREPFLSFILEVNWPNGRLLREYSVLLDPPISAPAVIGSMAAVERLPDAEAMPAEPLDSVVDEPAAAPVSEPAAEPEYIPYEPLPEESAPVTSTEPPAEPVAEAEPAMPKEAAAEPDSGTAETAVADAAPADPAAAPAEEPVEYIQPYDPETAEPPMSSTLAASEYGPVASGETLWEIASTTRPNEAVTLNQMMLALLRANPQAFYQDNVNTLKRGAVLRIPGPEEIEATRAAQAAAEVLNQNRVWIESTRPTLVADSSSTSSFSRGESGTSGSSSSRLELVPPASGGLSGSDRPGSSGGTANAASAAELARTKEALNSSQSESRELRDRVKELEGLTGKSERLIQLKDTELKALQDRLAAAEKRAIDAAAALAAAQGDAATARRLAEESAAKAAEAQRLADARAAEAAAEAARPVADPTPAATSDTLPDASDAVDMSSDEAVTSSDPLSDADLMAGTESVDASEEPAAESISSPVAETVPLAEPAAADPAPLTTTPGEEAAKPWYKNLFILGGGGLLIAALAALGLVSRSKRKATQQAAEPRSSIAHNFHGGVAGGPASMDSVETDLLNALAIDPTDLNAHLNVLEYFYTRRDPEKFEAAAEAMYAQVGDPQVAEWQGALLMGADICPSHPLFSGVDQDAPAQGFSDPFGDQHSAPAATSSASRDFGFGRTDMPTPKATPAVPTDDFDFDLVSEKPAPGKVPAEELSFDFDLDVDTSSSSNQMQLDVPSLEIPSLDMPPAKAPASNASTQQIPALNTDFLGDDAVATKIDLARAYLDMGDADGARSMLEEVLTEGSASQREEASKILSEIR